MPHEGLGTRSGLSFEEKSLTSLATTNLHDAYPNELHQCHLQFKDFGMKKQFSGRIRTVVTMHDTKLAQSLFREPGNGQVVVIDCGGSLRTAMLGETSIDIRLHQ